MDKNTTMAAVTNAGAGLLAGDEAARKIVAVTAEIKEYEQGRAYRVKETGEIEIVERLCGTPTFRRGDVGFYEALSFSRFVKRFRNDSTVIFADPHHMATADKPAPRFTALIDYHEKGYSQTDGAKWDLFRAVLPLRHTVAWLTWAAANGKPMTQGDFAQFLEDNLSDIAEPDGAKLVEIARTLEATTDVSWQSHVRADNGAHRFAYLETINGSATTAKDGKIEIPQELTLALQPFEGAKVYPVKARFRYRLAGSKVTLWFDLVRLQDVLKEAFNDELLKIEGEVNSADGAEDGITTLIYNGPAPAAQQPKD
jgi:uncharacterized protein YfdQ (DUF2303 family)